MGFKKLLTTLLLCTLGVASAWAQVTTGGLTGTVKDGSSNEMLIGATVKAVHVPSGTVYGTTTMDNGRFNIPNMRVGGPYTITVTYVSYKEETAQNVNIPLGQTFRIDFTLESAATGLQEVVVTGRQDKTFNPSRTGASTTIGRDQLNRLPTLNRSVQDFTRLTPQAGKSLNFAGRNGLYNSFTVDGSLFSNAFGITELPGSSAGAQPVSLDAIDQLQVNLAPYDVKLSGFTGAGINAVTKSGTNEFSGSVYSFFRSRGLTGDKVQGKKVTNSEFNQKQFGFRLGGPIIKNKLFFFVNGEMERQTAPASSLVANTDPTITDPSKLPAGTSVVLKSDLEAVRNLLINQYDYDPGAYENFSFKTNNEKITARIDWNISNKHKFTFRYSYLNAYQDKDPSASNSNSGRGQSTTSIYFENMKYRQYQKVNSYVAELNSTFSNRFSNNLSATYSRFRDYREIAGSRPFPVVDIQKGGANYISFGSEPFSGLNLLNQDILQITDNFNYYLGKHTMTFGLSGEFFKFSNGFAQFVYGQYRYASMADFTAAASGNAAINPLLYQLTYSAVAGNARPTADLKTAQFSAYAQDEFQVTDNFRLTYGVRLDIPYYPGDKLPENPKVTAMSFRNGEKLDVSKLPDAKLLWSPRLGFNWDVMNDQKLQVRGGTGVFTGRIPFVWAVNQAGQNGLLFGSEFSQPPAAGTRPFTDNVNAYIPANPQTPATYAINVIDPDFKYPQIWRSNLAADVRLPADIILTLEGIYTKDINAVYHRDANLVNPTGKMVGADNRDIFPGGNANRVNSTITNAIVLDNMSKGESVSLSAQVQKSFNFGLAGSFAYTYTNAKDITSSPGSQANSAYAGNQIVNDPNNPVLSYTNFLVPHRLIGTLNYNIKYAKMLGTNIALIYEGSAYNDQFQNSRISYVYGGSANRDNSTNNDLIYIPRDASEIELIPSATSGGVVDTRTPAQIWTDLDNFIKSSSYLNGRRGQYAERNGANFPWANRFDLKITQDIDFAAIAPKSKSKLQVTLDIVNIGNLLNSDWGVTKLTTQNAVIQFRDYNGAGGRPRYSFAKLDNPYRVNAGVASRWQMQLGVRYIFN
ncbi:TonB-dependent receptor [Chitinophaga lutea]